MSREYLAVGITYRGERVEFCTVKLANSHVAVLAKKTQFGSWNELWEAFTADDTQAYEWMWRLALMQDPQRAADAVAEVDFYPLLVDIDIYMTDAGGDRIEKEPADGRDPTGPPSPETASST